MLQHTVPATVDTRIWDGTRDPELITWLGNAHRFDGTQLVLQTPDGDLYPRPGWTLLRWPGGDLTVMSSRLAAKRLAPTATAASRVKEEWVAKYGNRPAGLAHNVDVLSPPHDLPETAELRKQLAAAISPILDEHPDHNRTDEHEHVTSLITNAVLATILPVTSITAAPARDSEATVQRVIDLYEQWVKAGPPRLGTSINREWDRRLAELHNAVHPAGQSGEEQAAPVDWHAIARQRERELKTVGEARRRAEMAIARVRLIKKAPGRSPSNLQANAQDDGWDQALDAVHAALHTPELCETKNARKDHPVHELLAALKAGLPHPDPVDLIRRYYDSIHELCCPYDHSEHRPGCAAAANRAALNETEGV